MSKLKERTVRCEITYNYETVETKDYKMNLVHGTPNDEWALRTVREEKDNVRSVRIIKSSIKR
ncbi:hypothetical protein [Aquimarina macrocephali]|uniref:hypothetical protein n=1 Tax=Aquimarina macrocephali TaxID=666563 RepID=UPI000467D4EA|nr:hypothetical protein [Aquimarina macrocephali]